MCIVVDGVVYQGGAGFLFHQEKRLVYCYGSLGCLAASLQVASRVRHVCSKS
jgi:hypothetical protein